MKKIALSISSLVISITICLLFVCYPAVNAQNSHKFVYNKSNDKEIVYLYDSVTYALTPYLKYEFTYNQDGLLQSRKAYRWNVSNNKWNPYYLFTTTFVGENEIQEFALWNSKEKDFTLNKEKLIFHKDGLTDVSTYISFKWNERNDKWEVTDGAQLENYIALLINNTPKKR